MKILIVQDYGTPNAGAEVGALLLRRGFRARGHDARLFTSTARPLPLPIPSDYTCLGTFSPARRVLQVTNPSAAIRLHRVVQDFRPDVVHLRPFLTQLSPLVLPVLRDVPTLLHMVNYDYICPIATKILPDGSPCHVRPGRACHRNGCVPLLGLARTIAQTRLRERWQSSVDRVVAMTEWQRRRLEEEEVHVDETIWEGIAAVAVRPPLAAPPTVAFAGRLIPEKGLEALIGAFARVREALPGARLVIAGDGPQRGLLEGMIADRQLEDCVDLLGHLTTSDLERALAHAWVQAVPSVWEEPFGMVTAEAMMRGTAVVVSDTGGLSELVESGRTGFKVEPGNPVALGEALLLLLSDISLAERLGRNARQFALDAFDEDRYLDRLVEIFHEIQPAPFASR